MCSVFNAISRALQRRCTSGASITHGRGSAIPSRGSEASIPLDLRSLAGGAARLLVPLLACHDLDRLELLRGQGFVRGGELLVGDGVPLRRLLADLLLQLLHFMELRIGGAAV